MLKYIALSIFLITTTVIKSQDLINWYTWEEGMTKAEETPKKFVVDLYTDWCGWCKRMDKATFQNPDIAAYINENYIPIKFDAEQKGDITFKEQIYKFVKGGKKGYHEVAAMLTNGKLSYPTVVFLDEDRNVIQALAGFIDAKTFDPIMHYFAEDSHKKISWSAYLNRYKEDQGQVPVEKKGNGHTRLVKGN